MTSQLGAVLTRSGKKIFADHLPPRALDVKEFEENAITFDMPSRDVLIKNLPYPGTRVFYLFESGEAREAYTRDVLRAGKYHPFPLPQWSFSGGGTFDRFWRKAPKSMVGAIEYVALEDDQKREGQQEEIVKPDGSRAIRHEQDNRDWWDIIYIEMMGVRKPWRRAGLNRIILKILLTQFPGKKLAFSPPTDEGAAFIRAIHQEGWPVELPKYADGGQLIREAYWAGEDKKP